MPRTWGTITKMINYFVNMEKYLQQVSHSLVSQGDQPTALGDSLICKVVTEEYMYFTPVKRMFCCSVHWYIFSL
jgi:hypothetical protein